jgi:hypothetical protein
MSGVQAHNLHTNIATEKVRIAAVCHILIKTLS